MAKHRQQSRHWVVAGVVLAVGVCLPVCTSAASASALTDSKPSTVVASRSFPTANKPKRTSLLTESASTQVESDSSWGGIEDLNVPHTKSTAEKEAEQKARESQEQAEREAQEAQARKQREQAQRQQQQAQTREQASTRSVQQASASDTAASANGSAVVAYALQFQGSPYRYGGTTPSGWDCSGFTRYVFSHFGVNLPHQSEAQRSYGARVDSPAPGDLMWKPGHVGIYVGNGMMVHASRPGVGTVLVPVYANFTYYRIVQ